MLSTKQAKRRLLTVLLVIVGSLTIFRVVLKVLPYPELDSFLEEKYSVSLLDRNGIVLFHLPVEDGLYRFKIPQEAIPNILKKTVLQNEDRFFHFHPGVNPFSIIRTLFVAGKEKRIVSGASTITMQLARIITPRPKSVKSKFFEIIDALRLEAKLGKGDILSLYLSHIPFGRNMEGFQAAAYYYFGKTIDQLTEQECEILGLIPRNPSLYDPISNSQMMKTALPQIEDLAGFHITPHSLSAIKSPHFVFFVKSLLNDEMYRQGQAITTTLDLEVQKWCENQLQYYVESAQENRISNGSLLLLHEGEIVAYVGSIDYFDTANSGQIDGVQILRQPGSTLKPYLYGLALEMGFNAASILPDIPQTFGSIEAYRPENYSQTYHGPVRLRTALASSLNIPAVYLLERVGVRNFIDRLLSLGFESIRPQADQLGLGLAVGNSESSLFELVRAFRSFKNDGNYEDLKWRKDQQAVEQKKVMKNSSYQIIRDILSDNSSRVLGFGRNSVLNTNYPAYFKTGTSNQFNNIWALGATEDFTCGVWMGNFSGHTVIGKPGSSIPATVVEAVLNQFSSKKEFRDEAKLHFFEICFLSGGLATENCSTTVKEFFVDEKPPEKCHYHSEPGIVNLPEEYQEWMDLYSLDLFDISSTHSAVVSPKEGAIYFIAPEIPLESQGVEFQVNGTGTFKLEANGNVIAESTLPYNGIHFLQPGYWELTFYMDDKIIERNVQVR